MHWLIIFHFGIALGFLIIISLSNPDDFLKTKIVGRGEVPKNWCILIVVTLVWEFSLLCLIIQGLYERSKVKCKVSIHFNTDKTDWGFLPQPGFTKRNGSISLYIDFLCWLLQLKITIIHN